MNLTMIYVSAGVMLLFGFGFVYLLLGRKAVKRPQDAFEWIGTGLSVLLIGCAGLLVMLAMRMEPRIVDLEGRKAIEDTILEVPAEDFSFKRVADDMPGRLTDFRGKVVLLNLWATWCPPCLMEIPELNRLYERYRGEGLVVLSISDERPDDLRAFDKQLPLHTVSGYVDGPDMLPELFRGGFTVRPTTYIIDREGVVRRYLLGARNFDFFETVVVSYL